MEFSREEVSHIEKNLGFIVFDWAKHLISNVLDQARKRGVSKVYMNTPQTIDSGNTSSDKLIKIKNFVILLKNIISAIKKLK